MPRQRTAAQQLIRQFSAASRPIYLVDDRQVIVYCNPACAAWARVPAEELVGQTCVYGLPAGDAATLSAAAAARLCPTPGALAGAISRGLVSAIDEHGELVFRQAEFLPLSAGSDSAELSVEGPALSDAELLGAVSATMPAAGLLVLVDARDGAPSPAQAPCSDDPTVDELHAELASWRHRLAGRYRLERMVGGSSAAARIRAQVSLAAAAPVAVSIVGPPGCGKEHVAKAIHYRRPTELTGALVPVACAALDSELLISTVVALGRSAAHPADRWRTLLLANVDALSLDAQAALVPLLGSLGSWRLIATAARRPADLLAGGTLRADLAAWLSTLVIELPTLRERIDDLPLLAQLFLEEINASAGRQLAGFTPEALDALAMYAWPGNLDELADVVRQAHEGAAGSQIGPRDLPRQIHLAAEAAQRPPRQSEPIDLVGLLAKIETELIERALARAKGNKSRAAHLLGLTRPKLYRRLVQLGLEDDPATPSS
ncbi:MAG TPA: helix-turn-helix domain-containing protein [Pirellulales bacterium]|jgi:DNA-binding NtrC family response regulator|nr:helix-turn-helix domain-containing protein [Pirellulales bacterium]